MKQIGDFIGSRIVGGCELINEFFSGKLNDDDDIKVPVIFGLIILPVWYIICRYVL